MLVIEVPDDAPVQRVDDSQLPGDWQRFPHPTETKEIGRQWISKGKTLLLEVPSAVYSDESNWLINPLHPMAHLVRIVSVKPFVFSDRVFPKD